MHLFTIIIIGIIIQFQFHFSVLFYFIQSQWATSLFDFTVV